MPARVPLEIEILPTVFQVSRCRTGFLPPGSRASNLPAHCSNTSRVGVERSDQLQTYRSVLWRFKSFRRIQLASPRNFSTYGSYVNRRGSLRRQPENPGCTRVAQYPPSRSVWWVCVRYNICPVSDDFGSFNVVFPIPRNTQPVIDSAGMPPIKSEFARLLKILYGFTPS